MLQLKVRITKADLQEGHNRYGESYRGFQCIGMEVDVPEGHYQNKVAFFTKEQDVHVGDVGTVNVTLDIRQYNNKDFQDARVNGWQCLEQAPL